MCTGGNCQVIEEEVVIFGLDAQDFCLCLWRGAGTLMMYSFSLIPIYLIS